MSGIRGSIKKAIREDASQAARRAGAPSGKAGAFPPTFEDKLLLSDVVVCRLWVPVEPPPLCLPVDNLLEAVSGDTLLARSVADVRRETQTPIPVSKDSLYKGPIARAPRKFAPQKLPKKLVDQLLPFASRPKEDAPRGKRAGYLKQREGRLLPVWLLGSPTEARRTRKLVHQLETVRAEKKKLKGAAKEKKKGGEARREELAKIDASRRASSKLEEQGRARAHGVAPSTRRGSGRSSRADEQARP